MGSVERVTAAGLRLPVMLRPAGQMSFALEPVQLSLSEMPPFAICYGQRLGQQREPLLTLPYRCRGLRQQGQTIRLKLYRSRGSPGCQSLKFTILR